MKKSGRYTDYSKPNPIKRIFLLFALLALLVAGIWLLCEKVSQGETGERYTADETVNTGTTVAEDEAEAMEMPVQESTEAVQEHRLDEETTAVTTAPAEEPVETEVEDETTAAEKTATDVSGETENLYSAVLNQYQDAIQMDSSEFLALRSNEKEQDLLKEYPEYYDSIESVIQVMELPTLHDRYPLLDGSTLASFHIAKADGDDEYSDPSVYHYAYYNIDGQRDSELLIGEYNAYRNDFSILAIYTTSYEGPCLLRSVSDDSRWHLTVYTDGTYCEEGSGGATLYYWNYYRIHNEYDFEENIVSFTVDFTSPGSDYLQSAVQGYQDMFIPVEDIVWNPLLK